MSIVCIIVSFFSPLPLPQGCFVLKWADKEYKKQEENEVDWEEGLVPRGLHFASFVTPESAKILETVEKVLEVNIFCNCDGGGGVFGFVYVC